MRSSSTTRIREAFKGVYLLRECARVPEPGSSPETSLHPARLVISREPKS